METQIKIIGDLLNSGHTITPIEALTMCGCFRLSAVIFRLKERGFDIQTTLMQNGKKRYAMYSIQKQD